MKIAHIADVHWRGLSRHEEYILSFNRFFKKAKDLKPDIIYVGGDIVHSKTQGISPELIQCLCWWFTKLAEICPVYVILGNHDGLILNKDRQDAITPIIEALNNPNIHLLKYTGVYDSPDENIKMCVFSCFDEENWKNIAPEPGKTNIAFYHGAVRGSLTDTDWQLDGEISIDVFNDYDYVLLGDIHKRQFLNEAKTVAYCGSTIQQNYGEDPDKGFLFWDIRGKADFDVDYHRIEPVHPFYTVQWQGSTQDTIKHCKTFPRQSRFRIKSDSFITQADAKRLQKQLKKNHNAKEVVFKIDTQFEAKSILDKENEARLDLRSSDVHKKLLHAYYEGKDITKDDWDVLDTMVDKYLSQISDEFSDIRNVKWSINNISFDNVFSYGENNKINFDSLPGITGIFGRNARGKSSIIGAIAYGLFNTTDRGSISNIHVINSRRDNCQVSLDVTINGQPYRIVRKTIKKQTKKNVWAPTTLNFYRLSQSGDILEDLTEEQRRETEKTIRRMLGTSEAFLMTSLASQGEMNTFIKEKASARKNILANFLDLDVFDKLYDTARKDSQELRNRASSLGSEEWHKKIEVCNSKIDEYLKKKAFVENEIEDTKCLLSELQKEFHSSDKKGFVSLKEIEHAQLKLDDLDKSLKNHQESLSTVKSEIKNTEAKVEKINIFIDGFDLEKVKSNRDTKAKIEKELLELKGIYNLENRELDDIEKSVLKLSEVPCGDSFPSCKFIKDSHKDKQRRDSQRKKVTFLRVKIDDIAEAFSSMSEDYDDQLEKYSKIIQKKSNLVAEMSNKKVKIERHTQNIVKLNEGIEKQKESLRILKEKFALQDGDDRIADIKNKIYILEDNQKASDNKRTSVINSLATWRANLKIYEKQKREYDDINLKLRVFDLFTQATSKRGIPVQLIHSLLPKINKESAKILRGVVGFNVEMEADLESNAMDIYINYGDSKRIIELGSGMEKMLASLAIRVALINMSSLPKTNMLIIDEGFGALDETNLEACSKLLESLKKYFKNILVISHIDAIKDVADNTLEITKKGVDSYVRQP